MIDYNMTNFAELDNDIASIEHLTNENAQAARKQYIDRQLDDGLRRDLLDYATANNHQFLYQDLVQNGFLLIKEVKHIYRKKKNDPMVLFLLEQVLGHAKSLFDNKNQATAQDLESIRQLTHYLTGHKSPSLQKLGIILGVLGLAVIIFSMFILTLVTMAASIGFFIGLSLVIASVAALWIGRQHGVAKAAYQFVDSISEIQDTLTFYEEFIAPMLSATDEPQVRVALETQLNLGFPAKLLKGALAMARQRYETPADAAAYEVNENYPDFFNLIADICDISQSNNDWLINQRELPENNHIPYTGSIKESRNKFSQYASMMIWKALPQSNPAISYFERVVAKMLDNEHCSHLKTNLQTLIKRGASPHDLKLALEWAVIRHQIEEQNPESPDNDHQFFQRIASICDKAEELIIEENRNNFNEF